jgi:hypothetical protein
MAALRKADALFAYDNTVDSFVISDSNGSPIFTCLFEPKQNQWIFPHLFIPVDDLAKNGQPLFQIFHASPEFPTLFSSGVSPPPSDQPVESLDLVDDVSQANKKYRVLKPATTDFALSPNELAEYFKQPVTDAPGYKWQPEIMSKDKVKLLHYHRLFGHAGLRHIRKLIKDKLGSGLLGQLPAGKIHCPVCAISKSTKINPLASTNREIERMDIMAVNLIGPFQVDSVDGGKYVMTMRDMATGYCFVCILTHKCEATGHIIAIIDKVETFTKKKLKILRSDNGGEFVNNELASCMDGKGIVAEKALLYHHY